METDFMIKHFHVDEHLVVVWVGGGGGDAHHVFDLSDIKHVEFHLHSYPIDNSLGLSKLD